VYILPGPLAIAVFFKWDVSWFARFLLRSTSHSPSALAEFLVILRQMQENFRVKGIKLCFRVPIYISGMSEARVIRFCTPVVMVSDSTGMTKVAWLWSHDE